MITLSLLAAVILLNLALAVWRHLDRRVQLYRAGQLPWQIEQRRRDRLFSDLERATTQASLERSQIHQTLDEIREHLSQLEHQGSKYSLPEIKPRRNASEECPRFSDEDFRALREGIELLERLEAQKGVSKPQAPSRQ